MKTVKLSEQNLKLIETLCDYTDKSDILNAIADALYYDACRRSQINRATHLLRWILVNNFLKQNYKTEYLIFVQL